LILPKAINKKLIPALIIAGILIYFSLPRKLFNDPLSTVITSADGELMGAKIASDGQWRFPEIDSVPDKFRHAVLLTQVMK
jgi:penicillin-binding protein 1C